VPGLSTRALDKVLSPAKIDVCSWGEGVTHIHWCLIPRMTDMPPNGIEVLSTLWDGRWSCSPEEAAMVADGVRLTIATET
jgi:hypothetical protein